MEGTRGGDRGNTLPCTSRVKYWKFNPLKYLLNIENSPVVDEFSMTLVKMTGYEMCPI
jgi:hypothetical protein